MHTLAELEGWYLDHHRAVGSSPKTVTHYHNTFLIFDRYLESTSQPRSGEVLTSATMNAFAAFLRATPTKGMRGKTERSVVTVHGHLKDLRAFVRWLHAEGHLADLPKVPLPKLPRTLFPVLSDEELARIYHSRQLSIETEIGKRNRALFSFMLDTGVRLAEVTGLTYEDLYLTDGMAKIWGKGSRERFVFFSTATADAIKLWLSVRGRDAGSLFWLKAAGVRMVLERIKDETGIPVLHAHQIRHTALTILVRNRVGIHSVRRMAGHSSLAVTERYLSLSTEDLRQEHAAASPVDQLVSRVEPERHKPRRLGHRRAA
jgi:site-specific recombinase XerD